MSFLGKHRRAMFRFRPVLNLGIRFSQIEENTSTKTKRFRLVRNLKNNSASRGKYAYGICTMPVRCFLSLKQDAGRVVRTYLTGKYSSLLQASFFFKTLRIIGSPPYDPQALICRRPVSLNSAVCVLVRRQSTISQLDDLGDHCYKELLSVLFIR